MEEVLDQLREAAAEVVRATEATSEGITRARESETAQKKLLKEGTTAGSKLFEDLNRSGSSAVSPFLGMQVWAMQACPAAPFSPPLATDGGPGRAEQHHGGGVTVQAQA